MKKLVIALGLIATIASPALAQSQRGYSYDCGPAQYDSSGAPVAHPCR